MARKGWVVIELPDHGSDGDILVVNQHDLTIQAILEACSDSLSDEDIEHLKEAFASSDRQYLIKPNPNSPESHRGEHVHLPYGNGLGNIELMFCIQGSATADLHTANGCESVILDSPTKAILIMPKVWHDIVVHTQNEDGLPSILVVVASDNYNHDSESNKKPCNCS